MTMTWKEIAAKVGCTPEFLYQMAKGKRFPGRATAKRLEEVTGISRLAWLYPDEYYNPLMPDLYRGENPPDTSHLKGYKGEGTYKN